MSNKLNFKSALEELMQLGKEVFGKEQKFNDFKLEDGTIVRTDTEDIQKGTAINVVSESGEAPLTDGEYVVMVMDKPVKVKVQSGYVTEIAAPEVPEEKPAEVPMESDFTTEAKNKFADYDRRISALEAALAQATQAAATATNTSNVFKAQFDKVSDLNKKMFDIILSIANSNSEEPIQRPAEKTVRQPKPDSFEAEIKEFQKKYKL